MLSEGRPGIDQVFSLRDGILRLEVDKPIYERMGLDAKPIRSEGRKHVKARFGKHDPAAELCRDQHKLSNRDKPPTTVHGFW